MTWQTICKSREVELLFVWLMLPLTMFGTAFLITPWTLVICSLGKTLFEPFVDGFQVIIRSDAVSRVLFGLLFIYRHMLLPTGLYYSRKDRRNSLTESKYRIQYCPIFLLLKKLGFQYTHDEYYPHTGLNHPYYKLNAEEYTRIRQPKSVQQ